MRQLLLISVVGAALGLTGCTELVSLNSIAGEADAIQDPAFAGVWGAKDAMYVIRSDGPAYEIVFVGKDSPARRFRGILFQAGEAKLLDLEPQDEEDPFHIPVHAVVRLWTGPEQLRWTFLDTDWLKEEAQKGLASQAGAHQTLLTAPGAAVRGFLNRLGTDERAFKETETLDRLR